MPFATTIAHALGYSVIFAVYVLSTLALFPRLWLRHYPANERDRQPRLSPNERLAMAGHAALFIGGILLALPLLSAWYVYGTGTGPEAVFRHVATLGIVVSLVDWLIVDWLILRYLQPGWLIPEGTPPASWRCTRDLVKDALGFPIGSALALAWAYAVSHWILG